MATKQQCCPECGKPLPPPKSKRGRHAIFCSTICQKNFNNRRMLRGAILYDLFMGVRYERRAKAGDMSMMSTVARIWHDEDEIIRGGRKSWTSDHDSYEGEGRDTFTIVSAQSTRAVREHKAKQQA